MNWEAIGALGEIAGALAVVASLVYLATQIRQSNKHLDLESSKHTIEQVTRIGEFVLQDESLVELLIKTREELNATERARLTILGGRMIVGIQQGYRNEANAEDLDGLATFMNMMYHREGLNYGLPDVWPAYRELLSIDSPDFVTWFTEKVVSK